MKNRADESMEMVHDDIGRDKDIDRDSDVNKESETDTDGCRWVMQRLRGLGSDPRGSKRFHVIKVQ